MSKSWQISRRTLLRGAGAAMALPWLEAMGPLASTARAARPGGPPVRMAFFYINNGIYMPDWTPQGEGYKYALSPDLKALEPVRKDVLVLSHLANAPKQVGGRGGDHVRSRGAYLTGNTIGAPGEEVRNAISVDQLAAKAIGHETYLPSLECGNVTLRADGTCDSNSCAYHTTISWRSANTPMPMERNPRMIFDRMFRDQAPSVPDWDARMEAAKAGKGKVGGKATELSEDELFRKSVLDSVLEDAKSLQGKVSDSDRQRIDEFLDSVRSVEKRIDFAAQRNPDGGKTVGENKDLPEPHPVKLPERGIPGDYTEYVTLLQDLMILGFQTDNTRIATCMLTQGRYPVKGADGEHHEWSHHGGDAGKQAKLRMVDQYRVGLFVDMVQKMKNIPEAGGTLLDNSMLMFGCGFGDGNRHDGYDIPILLAGSGGGSLKPGRHIKYPQRTPLSNLFLEMLARVGVRQNKFGDSDGRLPGLV